MGISVQFNVTPQQSFDLEVSREDTPRSIVDRIRAETGAVVTEAQVQKVLGDVFDRHQTAFDFRTEFPGSQPLLVPPKPLQGRSVEDRSTLLTGAATSLHGQDLHALSQESVLLDPETNRGKRVATAGPAWLAAGAVGRFPLVTKQGLLEVIRDLLVRLFTGEKTQFTSVLSQQQRDLIFQGAKQLVSEHPDRAFAVAMLPRDELEAAVRTELAQRMPGLSEREMDKIVRYTMNGLLAAIPQFKTNEGHPATCTLTLPDGRSVSGTKIGGGGMGEVWKVELPDGKKVVVKTPGGSDDPNDSRPFDKRFEVCAREVEIHHHVCSLAPTPSVGDFVGVCHSSTGMPLLITEFIPGKDVEGVMNGLAQLDLNKDQRHDVTRYLGRQMLEGLDHTHHERHVTHLDVKPFNYMLSSEDLRVKLIDFGLGKLDDDDQLEGITFDYLTPEGITRNVGSQSSDVWAVGIALCLQITGEHPLFAGVAFSDKSKRLSDFGKDPNNRMIPESDERFTPELRELVNRMLHPDPAQRPTTRELLAHPFFALNDQGDERARKILQTVVPNTVQ